MRCPSAYFLSRVLTFHSISVGGFLEPPPKYMSYSTLSRRNWSSSTVSSSSIAKEVAPFPRRLRSQGELSGLYHRRPGAPTYSRYRDLSTRRSFVLWQHVCRQTALQFLQFNTFYGQPKNPGNSSTWELHLRQE